MAQAPKLILNSDGMPWGRWVQTQVQQNTADIASLKNTVASSNSVQNAQLKQMSAQIQTLATQQATLASQQAQISDVVSHLGNLVRSGGATTSGFSWSGGSTWNILSTNIAVPENALYVDVHYYVEAVFCANSSRGTAINTYVGCSAPAIGEGSATAPPSIGPDVVVQSGQQQQRIRNYVLSQASVSGVSTITFYAFGAADNSGTNSNNYLKIGAQAIFSF